jgi:hypothetical protein
MRLKNPKTAFRKVRADNSAGKMASCKKLCFFVSGYLIVCPSRINKYKMFIPS